MPENTSKPNVVKPVLIAALICDLAAMEPHTRKKTLIGIFDRMMCRKFPAKRSIFVYFKIMNGQGEYEIEIRQILSKNGKKIGGVKGNVIISDRLASIDSFVFLDGAVFPESGKYDFQILANNVLLGSSVLDVHAMEEQKNANPSS